MSTVVSELPTVKATSLSNFLSELDKALRSWECDDQVSKTLINALISTLTGTENSSMFDRLIDLVSHAILVHFLKCVEMRVSRDEVMTLDLIKFLFDSLKQNSPMLQKWIRWFRRPRRRYPEGFAELVEKLNCFSHHFLQNDVPVSIDTVMSYLKNTATLTPAETNVLSVFNDPG